MIIYKDFGDWRERNLLTVFVSEGGGEKDNPVAATANAAQDFLKKAQKKYPKTELRKMTVTIDYTNK